MLEIVREVKANTDNIFIWTADRVQHGRVEDWRLPKLSQDGMLRDDCDGAAMWNIQQCANKGVPTNQLAVATCLTDRHKAQEFDHAVALHRADDGVIWVMDNRFLGVKPMSWFGYQNWSHSQFGGKITDNWVRVS